VSTFLSFFVECRQVAASAARVSMSSEKFSSTYREERKFQVTTLATDHVPPTGIAHAS